MCIKSTDRHQPKFLVDSYYFASFLFGFFVCARGRTTIMLSIHRKVLDQRNKNNKNERSSLNLHAMTRDQEAVALHV